MSQGQTVQLKESIYADSRGADKRVLLILLDHPARRPVRGPAAEDLQQERLQVGRCQALAEHVKKVGDPALPQDAADNSLCHKQ